MALLSGTNQNPIADLDQATTIEDNAVTINVLENDSDPDGNHFFITSAGPAAHGEVTFTADTVTYKPDLNYSGADCFLYTITDGHFDDQGQLGTATAAVDITVTPVDDLPVAGGDYVWVGENGAIDIPVRDNDFDAEGAVTVTWVEPSDLHQVAINPDQTIHYDGRTYYPPYFFPGQVGWSSLPYQITDSTGNTATSYPWIYTASDLWAGKGVRTIFWQARQGEIVLTPFPPHFLAHREMVDQFRQFGLGFFNRHGGHAFSFRRLWDNPCPILSS